MGPVRPRPLVLDAGGLIAFERLDRRVVALLEVADAAHIPAGALGQVWRNPARQARLARLVKAEEVTVHGLDESMAKAAGHLCGATGTDDVVDASVVLVARATAGLVLSSDGGDLRRIDPGVEIIDC